MQHPSFHDTGVLSGHGARQMAVEPWWLAGLGGQEVSTWTWTSVDDEMQDASVVTVPTEEQERAGAEIGLPLMLP